MNHATPLRKWLHHLPTCAADSFDTGLCDCGLRAALDTESKLRDRYTAEQNRRVAHRVNRRKLKLCIDCDNPAPEFLRCQECRDAIKLVRKDRCRP